MADTPPSVAESLLARAKEEGRARLRVYIGAAPGVGKSFKMLEDAHELRRQGRDVVIGFIEPHGRADTLAMVRDLERGASRSHRRHLQEMRCRQSRHPEVAVVDELARECAGMSAPAI